MEVRINIAELFVKLGVKGEDSTGKALKNVKSDMIDLSAKGLAVKASIIGAVYGIQQMMSKSTEAGDAMYKFSRSTELSTKELQKWQNAGMKAGVSTDEVASSIVNVQSAIADMKLGRGAPEGFGMLTALTDFDPKRMDDTFYMMEKIQELAQTMDAPSAKKFVSSFGIIGGMFGAMRKDMFSPKNMNAFDIYSKKQIKSFHDMENIWTAMYHRMEMTAGKFYADHGKTIVEPIEDAGKALGELFQTMTGFSDQEKGAKSLGDSIKYIADSIRDLDKWMKSSDFLSTMRMGVKGWGSVIDTFGDGVKGITQLVSQGTSSDMYGELKKQVMGWNDSIVKGARPVGNTVNNTSIKIDGAKDPKLVAQEISKIVNKTRREKSGGLSE